MNETYRQLRARHRREVAALPIRWAFGQKQIDETIEEMGCTIEDVCSIWGAGDIVRRDDVEMIRADYERRVDELDAAMSADPEFMTGAFVTEMRDREAIVGGYYPVLHCFGMDWEDIDREPQVRRAWDKARTLYEKECAAFGW